VILTLRVWQFGSKQSSPQFQDGTLRSSQVDGPSDEGMMVVQPTEASSDSSAAGSPIQMAGLQKAHGAQHHRVRPWDPNPYFQHADLLTLTVPPSTASFGHHFDGPASPSAAQPRRTKPASGQSTARSASPASMVDGFQPFAGTSSNDFPYLHLHHDRFPLMGAEAHTPTAIKG